MNKATQHAFESATKVRYGGRTLQSQSCGEFERRKDTGGGMQFPIEGSQKRMARALSALNMKHDVKQRKAGALFSSKRVRHSRESFCRFVDCPFRLLQRNHINEAEER